MLELPIFGHIYYTATSIIEFELRDKVLMVTPWTEIMK